MRMCIEITSMGGNPTFLINDYFSPITYFLRRSFTVELWCDWEWVD